MIHEVQREGSNLKIHASDSVLVTGVTVTVFGADRKVLEKGEAVKGNADWWEFIAQRSGKVIVEARDLARNVTTAEMEN